MMQERVKMDQPKKLLTAISKGKINSIASMDKLIRYIHPTALNTIPFDNLFPILARKSIRINKEKTLAMEKSMFPVRAPNKIKIAPRENAFTIPSKAAPNLLILPDARATAPSA